MHAAHDIEPTTQPKPLDPAAEGWEPYVDDGFIGLVGPFWQRRRDEILEFGFVSQPKHENRRGVTQGGMLMTFADRAMGMTAWFQNGCEPQATVQLSYQFIGAVQIGDFVMARAKVQHISRSLIFIEATLCVGERIIGSAQGVWKVLKRR
ncbi:PaaI family thioesterase [Bosea thiooxidans]